MKKTLKIFGISLIAIVMMIALVGCQNKEVVPSSNTTPNQEVNNNQEVKFSMGNWNDEDTIYTNEFLGLEFNLPEGWTHLNDEEIAKLMNVGVELLNDDQKAAYEIAELTSAYYMVANDPNTGNNINIFSEKPLLDVSMDYYLNQLKTGLEAVESMDYEIGETSTQSFSGKEFTTLQVSVPAAGLVQKYFMFKQEKYFVGIIATSVTGEETLDEMIGYFK